MINKIKKLIIKQNLDGYIVPKNDKFFTEYSKISNLELVSSFSGSAGFAIILKNKNYLFVDGRYTIQAKKQSGKNFKILEIPFFLPKNIFKSNKNRLNIGFDPKLFTYNALKYYFSNTCNLFPINENIFETTINHDLYKDKFYNLDKNITGESSKSKINRVIKILNKKRIDYLFVTAGENVCWLMNIRGKDLPNSPIANCNIILTKDKKILFFSKPKKISKIKNKIFDQKIFFYDEEKFFEVLRSLKVGSFCIDGKTCSVFNEEIIKSKFMIKDRTDLIYYLKSIKNKTEINNMKKAHIEDGVALTKFLYWIKNIKILNLTEQQVEKKLENFRKQCKNYLYPSFDTIAGSGPNGAIIHYRSDKQSNRKLNKNDLLLLDSGGQFKWGTTDVTRTICFSKVSKKIKRLFTRVLKGHIAVAQCDIKKYQVGHNIDKKARLSLNKIGLDYSHGTGHGVGFFLNVHEGPQSISKNNHIKLEEGMIVSNEPGYYLENKFGIRIENLVYIKKADNKLRFENLTFAPIDKDLIDENMLNNDERNYLFNYHLETYSKISPFLDKKQKKWLAKLI
ncbi:MAG: M24 family metallopeptidase [Candidatus Pelagibacter sp.]